MYQVGYRIQFTNIEDVDVSAYIWDTTSEADPDNPDPVQIITDLTPAGTPCTIQVINNDEDKFSPIRAKQCTLRFLSTSEYNLSTFIDDEAADDKWLVDVKVNDSTVFLGFLILDGLHQEFRDNFTHREVRLTALCGLNTLKNIPLTDFDGENPRGRYKIIEFVAWALSKTGHSLEIYVVNGMRHEAAQDTPGYASTYLDAKTFEADINTCISCYDVLQRILGMDSFIHQWKGAWWVRRLDEYEDNLTYQDRYDADATTRNTTTNEYTKNIGLNETMTLIAPASIVTPVRPKRYAELDYNYEYPKENIDNINFLRGDLYTPLAMPDYERYYHIDDWTHENIDGGSASPTIAYIKRVFIDRNFTYEKERYVVIQQLTTSPFVSCIKSNEIPLDYKDKFSASVAWRLPKNIAGPGSFSFPPMDLTLYGDDGVTYKFGTLQPFGFADVRPPGWYKLGTNGLQTLSTSVNKSITNESEWQTFTIETTPAPVSGSLRVRLLSLPYLNSLDSNIHFTNLQFEYIPFINGDYSKYKGQYHKVSSTRELKAAVNEEVKLSDAPKKLFKGALFASDGSLAGRWFNANVNFIRDMIPNVRSEYLNSYGRTQAFAVWNQYRRTFRMMDATVRGIHSSTEVSDLMHTYYFTDKSPHTNNKRFMLLHYEIDFYRCELRGAFVEVYDDTIYKQYDEDYEFKYLEDR